MQLCKKWVIESCWNFRIWTRSRGGAKRVRILPHYFWLMLQKSFRAVLISSRFFFLSKLRLETLRIFSTSSTISQWLISKSTLITEITIHRATNIGVPMWYFTQSHTLKMIFLLGYIKEASLSFWLFIHLMLFFFFLVCHRTNVLIGQCFRRLWSNLPYWWLQKKSHHHQFCLLHQDKKQWNPNIHFVNQYGYNYMVD